MRLSLAVLVLGIAASACGAAAPAPAPASPPAVSGAQTALKAPGEAKVGDVTKCPVSGEVFTVTAASPHADYDGKTYYFCCADCPNAFMKDPQKYLKSS
jgi:Cu+-exporting ATPase